MSFIDNRPVLIVDDDDDLREALRDTLVDEGYGAAEARDGATTLEYLQAHPLTPLVLLDWNMTPMNGRQIMDELLRRPDLAHIPVVVLTADARVEKQATGQGFIGCLKKPVALDALFDVVERYGEAARATTDAR